jgi:hypothetical protein
MKKVFARHTPPPEPDAPAPPRLWERGVLEGIAADAGLRPRQAFDHSWAFEFADDHAMTEGLLSAGGISSALTSPEDEVARALVEALAPYRTRSGGYRLQNEWHYLITSA